MSKLLEFCGLYDHGDEPEYLALATECRHAGIGEALPATVIDDLKLNHLPLLKAADWRIVREQVRAVTKPAKAADEKTKRERLTELHKRDK